MHPTIRFACAAAVTAEDADAGAWASTLADADAAALTRAEQAAPERFRALLAAVYRAYYTTPAAQAVIAALANAAPREPSSYFDESLLAQVIATQAGKRRL